MNTRIIIKKLATSSNPISIVKPSHPVYRAVLDGHTKEIAKLFAANPEQFIVNEQGENAIYWSNFIKNKKVKQEMVEMLRVLFHQYVADMVKSKKWKELVVYYENMALYYSRANDPRYLKTTWENAIFYIRKQREADLAIYPQDDLEFKREKTEPAISIEEELKFKRNLAETSVAFLKKINLTELYVLKPSRKYICWGQQVLGIFVEIAKQTDWDSDWVEVNNFHLNLINGYFTLADFCFNLATRNFQNADNQDIAKAKTDYSWARLYYQMAEDLLLRIKGDPVLHSFTQVKLKTVGEKILETRTGLAFVNEVICVDDGTAQQEALLEDLSFIAIDRSKGKEEIEKFFLKYEDECKINIDQPNALVNETVLASAIKYGSISSVRYLIEEQKATLDFIPTGKEARMLCCIGEASAPEVKEYLLSEERDYYQDDRVNIFIDALAGRKDKVKARLEANPDKIIQVMQTEFWGYSRNQKHIRKYLLDFSKDYLLSMAVNLENKKALCRVIFDYHSNASSPQAHLQWLKDQIALQLKSSALLPQLNRDLAKCYFEGAKSHVNDILKIFNESNQNQCDSLISVVSASYAEYTKCIDEAKKVISRLSKNEKCQTDNENLIVYSLSVHELTYIIGMQYGDFAEKLEVVADQLHLYLKAQMLCQEANNEIQAILGQTTPEMETNKVIKAVLIKIKDTLGHFDQTIESLATIVEIGLPGRDSDSDSENEKVHPVSRNAEEKSDDEDNDEKEEKKEEKPVQLPQVSRYTGTFDSFLNLINGTNQLASTIQNSDVEKELFEPEGRKNQKK